MERRRFVHRLAVLPAGAWASAVALPLAGCAGRAYLVPAEEDGALRLPASALADGGVFVAVPGGERPIFLHRSEDGTPVAVLARCTHRGCQPEPIADRLVCPCHGSEFDLLGNVLQGPAEAPLTRYEVATDGGQLVIRLGGRRP